MLTDVSSLALGVDSTVASSVGGRSIAPNTRRACRATRMTSRRCLKHVTRGKRNVRGGVHMRLMLHVSHYFLRIAIMGDD